MNTCQDCQRQWCVCTGVFRWCCDPGKWRIWTDYNWAAIQCSGNGQCMEWLRWFKVYTTQNNNNCTIHNQAQDWWPRACVQGGVQLTFSNQVKYLGSLNSLGLSIEVSRLLWYVEEWLIKPGILSLRSSFGFVLLRGEDGLDLWGFSLVAPDTGSISCNQGGQSAENVLHGHYLGALCSTPGAMWDSCQNILTLNLHLVSSKEIHLWTTEWKSVEGGLPPRTCQNHSDAKGQGAGNVLSLIVNIGFLMGVL